MTKLTTLMGYYAILAYNTNAFQIDTPDGFEPKVPRLKANRLPRNPDGSLQDGPQIRRVEEALRGKKSG